MADGGDGAPDGHGGGEQLDYGELIPRLHFVYGPADPRWGWWGNVPEWLVACYVRMLPRLESERVSETVNALLATNNRSLPDQDQRAFIQQLGERAAPLAASRPRAPRAGLGFLRKAGIHMKGGEN